MPKHILLLLTLIGLIAAAGTAQFSFLPNFFDTFSDSPTSDIKEEIQSELQAIQQAIFTPAPLRGPVYQDRLSLLTKEGTFTETNKQRALNDVPALTRNTTLDAAAASKLQDMFDKQYFEHISPSGRGPADVVNDVRYEYLVVGENLALGNFETDATLLEAWMNSPGHRANIVSPKFRELGIAVGEGMFEGKKTWLAVQTFGTPASTCGAPSAASKAEIEQLKNSVTNSAASLSIEANTIQSLAAKSEAKTKEGNESVEQGNEVYKETGSEEEAKPFWDKGHALQEEGTELLAQARAKQETYNQQIEKLNNDQAELSANTTIYNADVKKYNTCLKGFE